MRDWNQWEYEESYKTVRGIAFGVSISLLIWLLLFLIYATTVKAYTNDEIADAIFWAEGGNNTNYPYGIRSVSCEGQQDCRKICINTIRNNRKRYEKYGFKRHDTYLKFLASRYAPSKADNDPTGLNRHWLRNVTYLLENPK